MHSLRPTGAVLGALSVLVLSSCVDSDVVSPDLDAPIAPSLAIMDGSSGGNEDFYFLPPLASGAPSLIGEFNPYLLPSVRVCELVALGGACVDAPPVADFGPGAAEVVDEQYSLNWDTDGPETGAIDPELFYRIEVYVASTLMGWVELDPQDPDGPGQSVADAYPFRLGETIPVKFWLSTQVLCEGEGFVTECITGAVVDETGANLSLEGEGDKLGVIVFEGGLPGENADPITVTIERIDAALFLAATGTECLPFFDAPQFGECFRITTDPILTEPLDIPALVSICLDPLLLDGVNLPEGQENQLTMVRYDDDEWEQLPDAAGDCPTPSASLLPEPESGFFRYAAKTVNAIARFVGPQPLVAKDIRFGGFSSSFSRFRYAIPGQMIPSAGDGVVLQATDPDDVDATVLVVDHEGIPVENALVRFSTEDGTVSVVDVITDANGAATTTWTVDRAAPGEKILTASARGLTEDETPEHSISFFFTTETVDFTATVVGPPASVVQAPTENIDAIAGGSAGDLTVTVFDQSGNPVSGAGVTWTGDGSVTGGGTTSSDGSATGAWTLPETAGENEMTATVGGQTATFTATGAAGPAVEPAFSEPPSTGTAGALLGESLSVTVTDQFGNPREGDAVTWTVTAGGGSLSATSGETGADGSARVDWTLGEAVGMNQVLVEVEGFTWSFAVEGLAGAAAQPTGTGSGQTGTVGEALSESLSVLVTDAFGNPREGDVVVWSGDGSFSAPSTTTDASGVARVAWTLGTTAGAQTATATVGSFTVDFAATGTAAAPARLTPSRGGTATVGSTIPVSVTVVDAFDNPRGGDAVVWSVTGGDGSIGGSAITDAGGLATGSWTVGAMPGANTATASIGGLTATFSADGVCFDGYGMAQIDGALGAAEWACARSLPFEANISGGSTPAEVLWMNDQDNLYLAVRVRQDAMERVNSLRFDFDNDGDGVVEVNDDVIGYDSEGSMFFDESVDARCVNRNQSGCSVTDGSTDGAAAVSNDGTWTVFELTHALSSGEATDISVTTGDDVGFFLTLRIGNGAQGNTQFPGFREYTNIRIVGF